MPRRCGQYKLIGERVVVCNSETDGIVVDTAGQGPREWSSSLIIRLYSVHSRSTWICFKSGAVEHEQNCHEANRRSDVE